MENTSTIIPLAENSWGFVLMKVVPYAYN